MPTEAGSWSTVAFLEAHGVARPVLEEGARLAAGWQVSAAEALLATGAVSPDVFYRALARALDLPFLEPGFAAHPLARYPQAILAGIVPLADGEAADHALAPRGDAIAGLLSRRRTLVRGLAITTPAALREAVFRVRGEAIARQAAEQLARERPQHSFHSGPSSRQTAVILAFCLLVGLAAFVSGRPAVLAVILLFGCPFLFLAGIKIAAPFRGGPLHPPPGRARRADADLPVYTVLVALHRERSVLPQLRAALLALDYPATRLDVKLLIEGDDEETSGAIAALAWPGFVEVVAMPPGQPRTKPRALNVGLMLARGTNLVVFDAEDVPHPGQLRDAVSLFERLGPEFACLQARLVIDNTSDSLLTRFFTLEYGALFDVVIPALADFDLPIPLGGTSNHLKTEVARSLGGWDPYNVTEDADLGIRLALAGYRVADLPSSTIEEAPARLKAWLAQRTRWLKGYVQVAITHSRDPLGNLLSLGPWRLAGASVLISGTVASAAIYPVFTAIVLAQLVAGTFFDHENVLELGVAVLSLALLVLGLVAMILPALAAVARRGWWSLTPFAFLMPFYYLLVSLGAWRGILELVVDPDRWNKTEHGLARTSRSGERTALTAPGRSRARLPRPDDRG